MQHDLYDLDLRSHFLHYQHRPSSNSIIKYRVFAKICHDSIKIGVYIFIHSIIHIFKFCFMCISFILFQHAALYRPENKNNEMALGDTVHYDRAATLSHLP